MSSTFPKEAPTQNNGIDKTNPRKKCVFPDQSETLETRTFAPNEKVCFRHSGETKIHTGKYRSSLIFRTETERIRKYIIQTDSGEQEINWNYVGKIIDISPTTQSTTNTAMGGYRRRRGRGRGRKTRKNKKTRQRR